MNDPTLAVLKSGMVLPIRDLYTFFVVARVGAMQEAASEFGVTPGAISQRVKSLEERYGKRLFTRGRDGVALTAAGEALWRDVEVAFAKIETSHQRHFSLDGKRALRISAAPTFAHAFLVSNLGTFTGAHPDIELSIETEDRLVDLRSEPVDLAIRHGLGNYAGLRSEWLCAPELIVVGSPELLASQAPIESPADCRRFTLLPGESGVDWALWFEANDVGTSGLAYGTAFTDGFLTVKAAVRGQGLALISDVYVRDELSTGSLVRVLSGSWPTRFAYYAVALPDTWQLPSSNAFLDWLRDEVSGLSL